MQPAVFDVRKCHVPYVPRIKNRPIISACCDVPPPPAPIPECPQVSFNIPPAPPGCPDITASGTVTISGSGGGGPSVTVTVDTISGPCDEVCEYHFNFDFVLPG